MSLDVRHTTWQQRYYLRAHRQHFIYDFAACISRHGIVDEEDEEDAFFLKANGNLIVSIQMIPFWIVYARTPIIGTKPAQEMNVLNAIPHPSATLESDR